MKKVISRLKQPARSSKSSAPPKHMHRDDSETVVIGTVAALESVQTRPISNPRINAPLENLPPELRRRLLSLLPLPDLSAAVHASPLFHDDYLENRRFLLRKSLNITLGTIAIDAYAVYRSSSAGFFDARTREIVTDFIKTYQNHGCSTKSSTCTSEFTEDEALGIASFHSHRIIPLARRFTDTALANLADETIRTQSYDPLTQTEETRIFRSLYRFQLFCNLFGTGYNTSVRLKSSDFKPVEILKLFFCIFEPWEVEEINCIYASAKETCNQVFHDICWDVDENNPKFDGQRPSTPDGVFDLNNNWTRSSLLIGTVSRGLELLFAVLFTIKDHSHLVSTMQEHMTLPCGRFLEDEPLGETSQNRRRGEQLSERDEMQDRGDPLPFIGDGELDGTGLLAPLAWTMIWGGTYSNLYGYYVPDDLRCWGYVMWDATRMERTGANSLLMRQWEEHCWNGDPRDLL